MRDDNILGTDTLSEQHHITGAAGFDLVEDILAVAEIEHIGVTSAAAIQRIVTFAANQSVVAIATIERVAARSTGHRVGVFVAVQHVVSIGRNSGFFPSLLVGPLGAVGKADELDPRPRIRHADDVLQRDLIGRSSNREDEIASAVALRDDNVFGTDTLSEQHHITAAAGLNLVEDILAIAEIEHISVAAAAAVECIVALATNQNVVAATALQRVVASVSEHNIDGRSARKRIICVNAFMNTMRKIKARLNQGL